MESFEYDVFLSFARADEPLVRPVWEHLSASGLRVFWSDASLQERLGDSWFEAIEHSLERSRHFVLVCTPASMASEWVKREYRAFHSHCYSPGHRRLIPLLAQGFDPARLPLLMRELEARALDGAGSLRTIARMLGGADLESSRARLAVLEEENATLRATVERLSGEVERLKTPVPRDVPRDPARPFDRWPELPPERASFATGGSAGFPRGEPAAPPAPLDVSVIQAVRGWVEDVRVEMPALSDTDSLAKDQNSREVFGIIQWALPGVRRDTVVTVLRTLLRDSNRKVRWSAMRLLTYYQFADAAVLKEYWSREDCTVGRELVLECVAFLSEAEVLDLASQIARQDKSPRLRREAVKILSSYASQTTRDRITRVLMEALTDSHEGVRRPALGALAELKVSEAIMAASRMALKDMSQAVRIAAIEFLAAVAPIGSFALAITAFPGETEAQNRVVKRLIPHFTKRFGQEEMLVYVRSITDPRRAMFEAAIRNSPPEPMQ